MPTKAIAPTSRIWPFLLALIVLASACTDSGDSSSDDSTQATIGSEGQPSSQPTPTEQDQTTTDGDDEASEPLESDGPVPSGATGFSNSNPEVVGNPIWVSGPGNIPIKSNNEVAIRFVAAHDGVSTGASFIIKYDFERPNYHGGNCGQLQVSLRPDNGGSPADEILAEMVFDDPCGGDRDIGWLTDEPWQQPSSVSAGQTYHLVFSNLDPDPANFVSINVLYKGDGDDARQLDLSTGGGQLDILARGSEFWSGNGENQWGKSDVLADHYPSFELHYEDGTSQGVSYVGARFGSEVVLRPDDPQHLRQVFPVAETATVTALWFRGISASGDAVASAIVSELDGDVLFEGELRRQPGERWFGTRLPTSLTLEAGKTYAVEVAATAGTIEVRPMYQAQHDDWTSSEQSDWAGARTEAGSGDSWSPYFGELPHDLSLYFETDAMDANASDATEAVRPPSSVAIYGDSLIGEPSFDEPMQAALEARNVTLVGKDNDPGRDIARLLTALDTNPMVADVYIVAIGINGGQAAAEFEDSVRVAVAKIRQINPDAHILWTSLHALPVKQFIVDDRMVPRNVVLESLAAEGLVELIPWFEAASENPDIYGSDGVHFFGNELLYVETMIGSLDGWLATQE